MIVVKAIAVQLVFLKGGREQEIGWFDYPVNEHLDFNDVDQALTPLSPPDQPAEGGMAAVRAAANQQHPAERSGGGRSSTRSSAGQAPTPRARE